MGKNAFGLATTGFNVNKEVFVDNSKLGSSSKYGKSAIQKSHPNWGVKNIFNFRVPLGVQLLNRHSKIPMKNRIRHSDKQTNFYKLKNKGRKTVDLE